MRVTPWLYVVLALASAGVPNVFGDATKEEAEYANTLQAVKSGDAAKADAAVAEVSNLVRSIDYYESHAGLAGLKALADGKRFDDAERIAIDAIIWHADDTKYIALVQSERARCYLLAKKPEDALSAAKGYYNVAPLEETSAAIKLISRCLAEARPNEVGVIKRFKLQQLAGASTQPSTQPGAELGDPILPSIKVDPKPFEAEIDKLGAAEEFKKIEAKGNLLLLADRCKEAKELFQNAPELVEGDDVAKAVESEARALRALNGSVGAANAYILSVQQEKP